MSHSTVDEIRARFDADVERFSSLQTGQSSTVDAPLVLDLIAEAAAAATPHARRLLDIGCSTLAAARATTRSACCESGPASTSTSWT